MFEGSLESAKEHKPPRVMPQLMDYFKAIKVTQKKKSKGRVDAVVVVVLPCCWFCVVERILETYR